MSLSKYLLAGAGLAIGTLNLIFDQQINLVGVGAYFLSKDDSEEKFDPKVHTAEKLYEIMEDLYLDYANGYLYYHRNNETFKNQGKINDQIYEQTKKTIDEYTDSRDEIIAKKNNISTQMLELWIKKYQADPKVKKIQQDIQNLYDQVTVKHHVDPIHNKIHPELSKWTYVKLTRRILACVRHAAYPRFQEALKAKALTQNDQTQILTEISDNYQEIFRGKVFELFNIPVEPGQTAKRMMQRAYLTYSTVGDPIKDCGEWQGLVAQEFQIHNQIIEKLSKGERVKDIEVDPLSITDLNITYANYGQSIATLEKASNNSGKESLSLKPSEEGINDINNKIASFLANKVQAQIQEAEEKKEEDSVENEQEAHHLEEAKQNVEVVHKDDSHSDIKQNESHKEEHNGENKAHEEHKDEAHHKDHKIEAEQEASDKPSNIEKKQESPAKEQQVADKKESSPIKQQEQVQDQQKQ
ncbi:UNKNOWN [Stylonychia lemnae]|uniref:Uncharacterized protein n=1 Tax=Stylonychia lemnae TaxID=5949 RepID=A0A078B3D6_STYLE|nr:UNKNOWN [Stylonychia lemnae]|eukprot:CDW88771.1 UNKNOWN [Stylonychia lemnae]